MGMIDAVKGLLNKKQQKSQELPPVPPRKEELPSSKVELMPPPKVTDFDDEIPELPDLELPEELSPENSSPEPQPKSPVVPPPQERATQMEAQTPAEPDDDEISFDKIESSTLHEPETIEATPTPNSQESGVRSQESAVSLEPKVQSPVHPADITYSKPEGYEYIREFAFAEIVSDLKYIEGTVEDSKFFETLMDLDAQKQKAIETFQKEVKAVLSTLNDIDKLAFKR